MLHRPLFSALFVDYFFLRGQKLSLWSLFEDDSSSDYYYKGGYNWMGLIALLVEQGCSLFLYNPITGATH